MGVRETDKDQGLLIDPKLAQNYEKPANTVYKINNLPFYIVVALPKQAKSISGNYEVDFFNKSLPDKPKDSYRAVYNVFENIIPGIVENDFEIFVKAMNENVKLGLKSLEENIQSDETKMTLMELRNNFGFAAVSSLGPSLFAFSKNNPSEIIRKISAQNYNFWVYSPDGKVKRKINDDESILIASFACLGKTTFAKENPSIAADLESIHYAREYENKKIDDEVAKCDEKFVANKNYPVNYVDDIEHYIGKKKIIFLTTAVDALSELDRRKIKYIILYPSKKRKEQILRDAKKRGNDQKFVEMLDKMLSTEKHLNSFLNLNYEKLKTIEDDRYMDEYIREDFIL